MLLDVRKTLRDQRLDEPARSHVLALTRRLTASLGLEHEVDDPKVWAAGLEYLALRVVHTETEIAPIATEHGVPPWRVMQALGTLRDATEYRAYVGEWIREGCPTFVEELGPRVEPDESIEEDETLGLTGLEPDLPELEADEGTDVGVIDLGSSPLAPAVAISPPLSEAGLPSRWRAPFSPYTWQEKAARAWEEQHGRGIMQVVTGAGKTALAIYLYGRLLDRAEAVGQDLQLIVVVPRIELARQWAREFQRLLNLTGLRLGQYHSEQKCQLSRQDIVIITQDSARREIPRLRFDRPVFLVADECHRLGAPAASRLLSRDFTWTLGLSATPERGGDFGFEEILVPRLGPVVWKYGYSDAVRDGIIARFAVARVKVAFTPEEQRGYDDCSEKVTRLLDALKVAYPELRRAPSARFWQVMGDLKRRHPEDSRFDMLTAAASERRAIVHFAREKYGVVSQIAREVGRPRKVLCFHERIEAADHLVGLCRAAGRTPTICHSQIPEPTRRDNLERFRHDEADWLIACKSLDEGLDIPAVDTIVIAAGTKSPRQLIQRLGRALRRKEQDRAAAVVLVEVAGVDDTMLEHDDLSELREAAEEVVDLSASELSAWLRGGAYASAAPILDGAPAPAPRSSSAAVAPPSARRGPALTTQPTPSVVPPANKDRRLLHQFWDWGGRVVRRISGGSWTGTAGNRSYYDKDSSPD